tara:strand:- start:310 stop:879 length:570 start_codon:yes stop_codon:yes gene_type:complete
MSRGLHSDLQTELASDHLDQIHLIQFQIDGTTFYRTSAYFDITFDSNTYIASADLVNIPSISETSQISTSTVTFNLTSVDQTFLALFLNNNHIHRPVTIFRAYLNDSGALINNPFKIFLGYISGYTVNETTTSSTLMVTCQNHWANFEMKRGRRTNDNSQQIQFSGDKFFEFSNSLIVDLEWGKQNDNT